MSRCPVCRKQIDPLREVLPPGSNVPYCSTSCLELEGSKPKAQDKFVVGLHVERDGQSMEYKNVSDNVVQATEDLIEWLRYLKKRFP